ncbi:chromate transporter [Cladochytrium replicatum]|nr:chromate transporter [Cladochytrium replicatum]
MPSRSGSLGVETVDEERTPNAGLSNEPDLPLNRTDPETDIDVESATAKDYRIPDLTFLQLFRLFLNFGLLAWGGPVSQIAHIREVLVTRQRWITPARFNRVYAVYQVLPGPEAAELCCYFGYLARGRLGAVVAGMAFILPGFVLMLLCAYVYTLSGFRNEFVLASFKGLQPVVAAMVLRAVHKLSEHALFTHSEDGREKRYEPALGLLAFTAVVNTALRINFFITLVVAGIAYGAFMKAKPKLRWAALAVVLGLEYVGIGIYVGLKGLPPASSLSLGVVREPSPGRLFALGLLGGLVTFGGAYTAIPFVLQEAVVLGGWMTQQQFLDGIAIGNVLPAPLVIFSTFVGYLGGLKSLDPPGPASLVGTNVGYGFLGAIVCTIGMFTPCFAFTIIGHSLFEKLTTIHSVSSVLDGITAAVIGLILTTALEIARGVLYTSVTPAFGAAVTAVTVDVIVEVGLTAILYVVSLYALYTFKDRNTPIYLVLVAAAAGQFLYLGNYDAAGA